MINRTLPPLADGPNGAPRFSRAALAVSKGSARLLVAVVLTTAILDGFLPDQPIITDLFYVILVLVLVSGLLFVAHLASRPVPTRAQFADGAVAEAGELLLLARQASGTRPMPHPQRRPAELTATAHAD